MNAEEMSTNLEDLEDDSNEIVQQEQGHNNGSSKLVKKVRFSIPGERSNDGNGKLIYTLELSGLVSLIAWLISRDEIGPIFFDLVRKTSVGNLIGKNGTISIISGIIFFLIVYFLI